MTSQLAELLPMLRDRTGDGLDRLPRSSSWLVTINGIVEAA